MPNLKVTSFYIFFCVGVYAMLSVWSCASIQTPQGGPRDSIPPKVIGMMPKDLTRNFTGKKIVIEFDEYFKLSNEFTEFTISPDQEKPPILKVKQKKLEITLQDSLEKNTTYTLNFGKSVVDVNEGNVVKNLAYVFSTGAEIDSLTIEGKVTNALTGEAEKEATVFIFPLERDSLFGKKRPSIYRVTDSAGNYKLSNLRKGEYKVYALKEASGGDKIYQQISDEVGFLKNTLILNRNEDNVNLQVFKELAPEFRVIERKINNDGSISLTFNQQLKKPSITFINPKGLDESKQISFSKNNDSIRVWLKDLTFDSTKVQIKDQDKELQTITLTRDKKDTYTRTLNISDNTIAGKLNPFKGLSIIFNFPIISSDASKIILLEDSVRRTNFELIKDSTDFLRYQLKFPWKQKKTYDVKFGEGSFTAIFDTKNKEITKTFILESADNYATLALKTEIPDTTEAYIIQLLNEKKDVIKASVLTKNDVISFVNYPAGNYFIRVVYDENKNGIWDTGNVRNGIQPEKIWYSPTEMSLKANWEREEKLTIPESPYIIAPKPPEADKEQKELNKISPRLREIPDNLKKN